MLSDTSKLLVLIWHLVLFSLFSRQTLVNWQHSSNFPWDCKMAGFSKVTEPLRQEVVRMKAKGRPFQPLQEKLVVPNLWFLKYCSFTMTLIHSSPNAREDRIIQRLGSTLQMELLASSLPNRVWICLGTFKRSRTERANKAVPGS